MRQTAVHDPTRALLTPEPGPATLLEATLGLSPEAPHTAGDGQTTTSGWRPETPNIDRMELRRIVIEILG